MRGPGTTEGNFAVESALDELSYTLGIDPIELRLRNYAEVHPGSGRAWSSEALRECYRVGAERFGWARRTPETGSMRDGNWLVGYGMAGVTFTSGQARCQAAVSVRRDGTAHVRSAATDLGTGTYTIATQVTAAEPCRGKPQGLGLNREACPGVVAVPGVEPGPDPSQSQTRVRWAHRAASAGTISSLAIRPA
jgi:CO/xanthine dehydrogenase Mo-binding subunit